MEKYIVFLKLAYLFLNNINIHLLTNILFLNFILTLKNNNF